MGQVPLSGHIAVTAPPPRLGWEKRAKRPLDPAFRGCLNPYKSFALNKGITLHDWFEMLVLKKHLHLLFRGSKAAVDVDHGWYDGSGQELVKNKMAFFLLLSFLFIFSSLCSFFVFTMWFKNKWMVRMGVILLFSTMTACQLRRTSCPNRTSLSSQQWTRHIVTQTRG